jgi:hypothetical protein
VTALGNKRAHLFARPARRAELVRSFEALKCGWGATVSHGGMAVPMLALGFSDGGYLSIEFPRRRIR